MNHRLRMHVAIEHYKAVVLQSIHNPYPGNLSHYLPLRRSAIIFFPCVWNPMIIQTRVRIPQGFFSFLADVTPPILSYQHPANLNLPFCLLNWGVS